MTDQDPGHEPPAAVKGYAICTVGRSGSTWLAETLSSTGVLGRPAEYFSTEFQRRLHGSTYPNDRRAQVGRALRDGTSANGIYGLKIFPIHLKAVSTELRWTDVFPNLHFVHLKRRDVLGQALSRFRAVQTQQWRSTLAARIEPTYDAQAIWECLRWVVTQDARWDLYFARNGIEPLRLVYEDALRAPQATADSVATLLDLDAQPVVEVDRIAIAVQRDALTDEWRARFLADFADRDSIDAL